MKRQAKECEEIPINYIPDKELVFKVESFLIPKMFKWTSSSKRKKSFFWKILHKETMWMQNTFLKKVLRKVCLTSLLKKNV